VVCRVVGVVGRGCVGRIRTGYAVVYGGCGRGWCSRVPFIRGDYIGDRLHSGPE